MAKKRRKSSAKCPEPFNTLIDIAAGATMNAIASKMEDKYQYRKRGVINPYRASAFGMSMGKLNSTESIIKLGGFLGAMGSFDPIENDSQYDTAPFKNSLFKTNADWEYDNIGCNVVVNDNKYAWRMNCEDGSNYGISPLDYETRESYNAALEKLKNVSECQIDDIEDTDIEVITSKKQSISDLTYVYYKVSRLDNGQNDFYRSSGKDYAVGDVVLVPTTEGNATAIITYIKEYKLSSLPKELKDTEFIIDS